MPSITMIETYNIDIHEWPFSEPFDEGDDEHCAYVIGLARSYGSDYVELIEVPVLCTN